MPAVCQIALFVALSIFPVCSEPEPAVVYAIHNEAYNCDVMTQAQVAHTRTRNTRMHSAPIPGDDRPLNPTARIVARLYPLMPDFGAGNFYSGADHNLPAVQANIANQSRVFEGDCIGALTLRFYR